MSQAIRLRGIYVVIVWELNSFLCVLHTILVIEDYFMKGINLQLVGVSVKSLITPLMYEFTTLFRDNSTFGDISGFIPGNTIV